VVDVLTLYHRLAPRDLASAFREYVGREHAGRHRGVADAAAALAVLDAQVGRHNLPATAAALHAVLVEVDVAGRFRRGADGTPAFGFGKYRGRSLGEVARADPAYLRWLLGQPLLDDARDMLRAALADCTRLVVRGRPYEGC
jgi:hypothetical protein